MKLFQIDYKRLVLLLLPTFLRQSRIFAFMTALTFSVSSLYDTFKANRERNLRRLKFNGQVCYLQKMLNDELDFVARRISISDKSSEGQWLIAMDEVEPYQLFVMPEQLNAEGKMEADRGNLIFDEGLLISDTAIFHLSVPWAETDIDMDNRLKSLLNEYKLLSKKYKIERI